MSTNESGKGKQRAEDDGGMLARVGESARRLVDEASRPSFGSTSFGSALEADEKALPSQLRRTALDDASMHADTAGPSTSRAMRLDGQRASTAVDQDFDTFARPQIPSEPFSHSQAIDTAPLAAQYSARDYTDADLAPRPADGADILALLNGTMHDMDDYEATESEWTHADSDLSGFEVDEEHSPYLLHLLRSPFGADARTDEATRRGQRGADGEAILRYLEQTRYTDDVWSLPAQLRKLVLAASGSTTTARARDQAIARLGALSRQLEREGSDRDAFARAWAASEK